MNTMGNSQGNELLYSPNEKNTGTVFKIKETLEFLHDTLCNLAKVASFKLWSFPE